MVIRWYCGHGWRGRRDRSVNSYIFSISNTTGKHTETTGDYETGEDSRTRSDWKAITFSIPDITGNHTETTEDCGTGEYASAKYDRAAVREPDADDIGKHAETTGDHRAGDAVSAGDFICGSTRTASEFLCDTFAKHFIWSGKRNDQKNIGSKTQTEKSHRDRFMEEINRSKRIPDLL